MPAPSEAAAGEEVVVSHLRSESNRCFAAERAGENKALLPKCGDIKK
jgi:hypothetical protein